MAIPNKDELEGKWEQAKGSVKEGVGDLTGNRDLENEGEADQAKGEAQEDWGKVKRKVGETVDSVGETISDAGNRINK